MKKSFEEYLDYVSKLPYFERRIEINRRIKPRIKRFIYKYKSMDADDDGSIDRVRDLLIRSRLWLSSPVAFNDPFDMSANVEINGTGLEIRNRLDKLFKRHKIGYKERKKQINEFMSQSVEKFDDFKTMIQSDFNNNIDKTGVFSFAGDPRNILMWSHYSNDHTGICIQFEVTRDFMVLSGALPVAYTSEYPVIDWVNNFEKSIKNVLLRKHVGWKYEDELRIVKVGDADRFIYFKPKSIARIIIGCRASDKVRNVIEELLVERRNASLPSIEVLYAKEDKSNYKLSIFS